MKKVYHVLTNKFLLTGVAFLVWMAYFDQNDWVLQKERKKELQATRDNITYLNTEVARMEKENMAMRTNPAKLEQYARETFRMKRDNEDLYIIEKK
ncbi:MAG: septum formation initiator family protein [Taibaiella sp.]|nr:septum formation initiator family protein [Taibaiella sp.]